MMKRGTFSILLFSYIVFAVRLTALASPSQAGIEGMSFEGGYRFEQNIIGDNNSVGINSIENELFKPDPTEPYQIEFLGLGNAGEQPASNLFSNPYVTFDPVNIIYQASLGGENIEYGSSPDKKEEEKEIFEKYGETDAVPEPGTLFLFGVGLIGLLRLVRKKR